MAASPAYGDPIRIVAAENFYGDVARQVGGPAVAVTSILRNPDQDPHLFEVSPSVGRGVAGAAIVIYSGIGYDSWIEKLLEAARSAHRKTIVVADLIGRKTGDNPHIWYDPATMPALATALAQALVADDPAHEAEYRERLARVLRSLMPLRERIAALRSRVAGTPVTATEPIAGDLLAALGLDIRNRAFQLAVMNNTEPSASAVAGFEDDLKSRRVRLLVYNRQAADPIADRLRRMAETARIPVVGASETEPAGTTYQGWMTGMIDDIGRALPMPAP